MPSIKHTAAPLFALLAAIAMTPPAKENIAANDNRRAAGTLERGVLTVSRSRRGQASGIPKAKGPSIGVAAWAEEGQAAVESRAADSRAGRHDSACDDSQPARQATHGLRLR